MLRENVKERERKEDDRVIAFLQRERDTCTMNLIPIF